MISRLTFFIFCLLVTSQINNSIAFSQVARRGAIQGQGTAINGDTIKIGQFSIRLVGIDAPELGQICVDGNGTQYKCGNLAKNNLQKVLELGKLYCQRRGGDGLGRELVECWILGKQNSIININEYMIITGMALAFTKFSEEYTALEALAKKQKSGIWSGKFEFPWEYREKLKTIDSSSSTKSFIMNSDDGANCPTKAPYCKNIRSCSRACLLLKCGFTRLDRDNDGIPCENVCRRRCP